MITCKNGVFGRGSYVNGKRPCRLSKIQMTVAADNCGRGRSTCICRNINYSVHKKRFKNSIIPGSGFHDPVA